MKSLTLSPKDITVLSFVERPLSRVADDRDAKSIAEAGIKIPLIVVEHDGAYYLANGLRRWRIAKSLKLTALPCVAYEVPSGKTLEQWVRHLRLITEQHAQNLAPTQKAAVVRQIMALPVKDGERVTKKDAAVFLGVDTDTVTNWLSIERYVPEIAKEIDAGRLTMQRASVLKGLSPDDQREAWKEKKKAILTLPVRRVKKMLKRPTTDKRTQPKPRKTITANEHSRLLTSVELKEIELEEGKQEMRDLQTEINQAIAPINAILRDEELRAMVPEPVIAGFQVFAERH